MQTLYLYWQVRSESTESIIRYCSHCQKKVPFYDTDTIRINANGKKLHFFIRYRCESGHTWSKPIKGPEKQLENAPKEHVMNYRSPLPTINFEDYINEQYQKIVIHLQTIDEVWRLDKLLASTVVDRSRNELVKAIKNGSIMVDHREVLPKHKCKQGDEIVILLSSKN